MKTENALKMSKYAKYICPLCDTLEDSKDKIFEHLKESHNDDEFY